MEKKRQVSIPFFPVCVYPFHACDISSCSHLLFSYKTMGVKNEAIKVLHMLAAYAGFFDLRPPLRPSQRSSHTEMQALILFRSQVRSHM